MTRAAPVLAILISLAMVGCSPSPPEARDLIDILRSESIDARNDDIMIGRVDLKSSTQDGKTYTAIVTIKYDYSKGSDIWMNEGTKDFIPNMSPIKAGINIVDATAVFTHFDDGSWHLDSFR